MPTLFAAIRPCTTLRARSASWGGRLWIVNCIGKRWFAEFVMVRLAVRMFVVTTTSVTSSIKALCTSSDLKKYRVAQGKRSLH